MIAVIVSRADPASRCIGRALLSSNSWEEQSDDIYRYGNLIIYYIDDMHLYHNNIDQDLQPYASVLDAIVFASRHSSSSGKRTLSVHPIGNYKKAEFGGFDETLTPSAPRFMHHALLLLKREAENLGYNVCYEVTHHGPYLSTPTFFIEVGSTEVEWQDKKACHAVASAIQGLDNPNNDNRIPVAIGVGGGHYAPRFTDFALDRVAAFGHMIPGSCLEKLNEDMAQATVTATPYIEQVYFHSGRGMRFAGIFKKLGLECISV